MPVDPRKPYKLWLDAFEDVPAEERPAFVYRRITGAEYNDIATVRELEGKKLSEEADAVYAALSVGLVDWKNQTHPATGEAIPFDLSRLPDVLDPIEAMQLVGKRLFSARVSGADLKN